jgi:hypothetical protein
MVKITRLHSNVDGPPELTVADNSTGARPVKSNYIEKERFETWLQKCWTRDGMWADNKLGHTLYWRDGRVGCEACGRIIVTSGKYPLQFAMLHINTVVHIAAIEKLSAANSVNSASADAFLEQLQTQTAEPSAHGTNRKHHGDKQQKGTNPYCRHAIWANMFERLRRYKEEHGDCLVSNRYAPDRKLATWVFSQRRHYKLFMSGSPTSQGMTLQRVNQLKSIGFVWSVADPLKGSWGKHFQELVAFKKKHGHYYVPYNDRENVHLSKWVYDQRCELKLTREGQSASSMITTRIEKLNSIGFVWTSSRDWNTQWKGVRENEMIHQQENARHEGEHERNALVSTPKGSAQPHDRIIAFPPTTMDHDYNVNNSPTPPDESDGCTTMDGGSVDDAGLPSPESEWPRTHAIMNGNFASAHQSEALPNHLDSMIHPSKEQWWDQMISGILVCKEKHSDAPLKLHINSQDDRNYGDWVASKHHAQYNKNASLNQSIMAIEAEERLEQLKSIGFVWPPIDDSPPFCPPKQCLKEVDGFKINPQCTAPEGVSQEDQNKAGYPSMMFKQVYSATPGAAGIATEETLAQEHDDAHTPPFQEARYEPVFSTESDKQQHPRRRTSRQVSKMDAVAIIDALRRAVDAGEKHGEASRTTLPVVADWLDSIRNPKIG